MKRDQLQADDNQEHSSHQLESATIQSTSGPTSAELEHLVTLMRQGCYANVETRVRKITERFPNFGYAWKIQGTSFLLQGRNEEALASLLKAVSLLPEDPDLHSNLGLIFYELARYDKAENHCRLALKFRPNNVIAYNNLGNILQAQGRIDDAVSCFRRA